jgi:hypothetical protein
VLQKTIPDQSTEPNRQAQARNPRKRPLRCVKLAGMCDAQVGSIVIFCCTRGVSASGLVKGAAVGQGLCLETCMQVAPKVPKSLGSHIMYYLVTPALGRTNL